MPFTIAAKTGTSKDYRDNWAIGYTPEWTVAVWVGNFDSSPMRGISGITGAAPIMREISMSMHKLYGSSDFVPPKGIKEIEICAITGLRASDNCTARLTEYFNTNYPPRKICNAKHHATQYENKNLNIEFPKDGDVFKIDPSYPIEAQAIGFRAEDKKIKPEWFIDGKKNQTNLWQLQEGKHKLYYILKGRKSKEIIFTVVK